ncbi:hypothetical protein BCR44DRAFT_1523310 [Catenaria anguillulae PL171]|uniref:Uncharacterized protein n=1 Tax=Catenaria anguillulae PL171 TaxID=765915 RepID=A0A1Y2HUH0_9FUNG|nr:hypothetical protein BCR44DRAFT_1523310 [Catenaria anguillulae PL171]
MAVAATFVNGKTVYCAQSKCQSASGGLGQRLSNLLANPSAAGSKDLTAHQVAGAIRDTLDLAGACVQRECPDVASTCLSTLCSRGSCVRSASAGTQCTQNSDCTASLRGPSAPGTPADPLPDPAAAIKPASSDSGLFTSTTSPAWGGVADSPFARTGIAIPRLAYCHKGSRTCRPTLPLDSVLGSALTIAYPIRSSNDTRFAADAPLVPAARARLTARRCTDSAHCPVGVCSAFLHQCTLDRPLHIQAALLASPNGGSGAGEGIGPLIAMIAGGIGAAILLVAAGFFVYRARNPPPKPTEEELAREEAEFVASVHRMSMASGFPASLMSGGNRNSYYAPTDANGKPIAVRPSIDSSRSGGEASSQTARAGAGAGEDEEEFWKFERPDFDKPIGFRRNRTAVNANGGGARHSTGSPSSSPTRLSSPAAHRLSANRMSGATAVTRPVSSASGLISQNRHSGIGGDHRNSWLAAGGNARRPSAGPMSPRTPTKLAPVSESDDDTAFTPGSPASLPLGSPRARPTLDDRPVSMVVGSRPAPTAAGGIRAASYVSSRRGSALDKPLPSAPTPVMTPSTPSAAAAAGPMSPLPAMEASVPVSTAASGPSTARSLANPTPEFAAAAAATSTSKSDAPVPVFNLILPTLERSAAEAATLTRHTDAAPPVPAMSSERRSSFASQINITERKVTNPPPRRGSFVGSVDAGPQPQQQQPMVAPPSPKVPPKDHPVPVSPLIRPSPAPAPALVPASISAESPATVQSVPLPSVPPQGAPRQCPHRILRLLLPLPHAPHPPKARQHPHARRRSLLHAQLLPPTLPRLFPSAIHPPLHHRHTRRASNPSPLATWSQELRHVADPQLCTRQHTLNLAGPLLSSFTSTG